MSCNKLICIALVGVLGAACGDDSESEPTVVEVARAAGNFTTLVAALEATGLDEALAGEGPFTVLAPTDDAFARLPDGVLDSLDEATLAEILSHHVLAGEAMAADVVALTSAETLAGDEVAIRAGDDGVFLDGLTEVVQTDIAAGNGVIHVLDSVLLPTALAFPGTLVDLALAYPALDTLAGAVVTAELDGALSGDNDGAGFTLFAPTNAAFDALGVDLATLSTEDLTAILLYHVVGDTVDAATVVGLSSAPTLEGSDVAIEVIDGTVRLDDAVDVIATDRRAANGIVHVIDGVLSPL
jgi:transforming growth factor-beta-induced protein